MRTLRPSTVLRALVNAEARRGLITKAEVLEEIKRLRAQAPKAK